MRELAAMSAVVLACITLAYFYAWDLYRRRFFLFMGFAWASNALYLYTEMRVTVEGLATDFTAVALLTTLCTLTTAFFLAAFNDLHTAERRLRIGIVVGSLIVVLTTAALAIPSGQSPAEGRIQLLTSGVAVVTAFALFGLGVTFVKRPASVLLDLLRSHDTTLREAVEDSKKGTITATVSVDAFYGTAASPMTAAARRSLLAGKATFAASCIIYGAVQLLYPFRSVINESGSEYFTSIFWISFGAKVIHGAFVPALLLAEFRTTAEALRTRSVAEELGVLTASIEHDIRSPLAVIVKELETIRLRYQHDKWLTRKLAGIEDETHRINTAASVIPATRELVEHFSDHAEIVNIVHIVRDAVAAVRKVDRQGDIRVTFDAARPEIRVRADTARLKQAFVNILNNGVEACRARPDKRQPLLEVTVRLSADRAYSIVQIVDHGVGISEEAAKQLGRPMFSTKSGNRGNRGIGLFIATRAFRLHGGDIRLESDGSSFTCATISLPRAEESVAYGGKLIDGHTRVANI